MDLTDAAHLKLLFEKYDHNGDGTISRAELETLVRFLYTEGPVDVDSVFEMIDANDNGVIDYNEFVDWIMQDHDASQRLIDKEASSPSPLKFSLDPAIGDAVELVARDAMDAALKSWCGPEGPSSDIWRSIRCKATRDDQIELFLEECYCSYMHTFKVEELMAERPGMYRVELLARGDECFDACPRGDGWMQLLPEMRDMAGSLDERNTAPSPLKFSLDPAIGDAVELAARDAMDAVLKAWCGPEGPSSDIWRSIWCKSTRGDQIEVYFEECYHNYTHTFKVEELMVERPDMYRVELVGRGDECCEPRPGEEGWAQLFPATTQQENLV